MRVEELLRVVEADEDIVITDYDAPIDECTLYKGVASEFDRKIGKMHVLNICAIDDAIFILAKKHVEQGC